MILIDKRTKKHPDAMTPDELERPSKGNKVYYDDAVKGFGLRVTSGGARSFILNYLIAGRERRYTIGKYPDHSVASAREEAKRLKRKIRDNGYDPLTKMQADREAPTMTDLAERYIEEHLPEKRPSSQRNDRATITQDILPGLGRHKKVADIDFTDIKKLHRKISERAPYKANRVVSLISKMFSLAENEWRWRSRLDGNPCKGIKRNQEVKRDRYLNPDELARLMIALDEFDDIQAANIVRVLLATGARSGEVFAMRWDQLDLNEGTWTRPGATTKQKTWHKVPLSPDVVNLLSKLFDDADDDAEFVFPGGAAAGHRGDLKGPWPKIRKAAAITNFRMHDLRHSYASFIASDGRSLPIIGALLGHTQASTTQRYAHLLDSPLRKATTRVGARIAGAGKRGAKVIPMTKGRR
jgi:integrase